MTDTQTELAQRFAQLQADMDALGAELRGPAPLLIPPSGLVPNVIDGQLIDTAWGNGIRDRVTMPMDSLAALKAGWVSPPDGARAYLLDEGSVCVAKGGTWRWYQKTFPVTAGNASWITWSGIVNPASSISVLVLNGRGAVISVNGSLSTAVTSSSGALGTLAAGLRPSTRMDCGAVGSVSTGAGSGRGYVDTGGTIGHQFIAANNPSAFNGILMTVAYSLPDLAPA